MNTRSIAEFFEIRGATIGSHDPLSVPARTAAHLFRATRILVDLPDVLVVLVLVSSLAGLAILAFRGPHVLVGRFLIACLAVALLGSVAGVVPIGAPNNSVDRVNIWLFPVLAVGFARAATLLAGLVSPNLRRGLAIPAVALTMALGWQALTTEITYPLAGVTSAQERVMRELDDETAIWVTRYQVYGFVLEGSRAPNRGGNGDVNGDVSGDVSIVHQTHKNVGFAFDFDDPRLVSVLYGTEDEKLDASIGPGVNRVVVVSMRLPPDDENRKRLSWHLAFSGFERVANEDVGALYASAGVVLNDHHLDMRRDSFASNRLFDAAACGARIVSDSIEGLQETFSGLVQTFRNEAELQDLITAPYAAFPDHTARRAIAERIVEQQPSSRIGQREANGPPLAGRRTAPRTGQRVEVVHRRDSRWWDVGQAVVGRQDVL